MKMLGNRYSLLTIAVVMILTGFVIFGAMFAIRNFNIISKNTAVVPANPKQDTNAPVQEPVVKEIHPTKGVIEGTFNFPGEQIPKTLIPCAEHIESKEIICAESLGESGRENSFMIIVPEGPYYVYATNTEDPNLYKAYYTEFVTCGLLAGCPSHEKIIVEVTAGETVSGIRPHDWYD